MSDHDPTTTRHEPPIAETLRAEVLGASITDRDRVSVSIRVEGQFERPGSRATVAPVVIVATIPAQVLPG